MIKITKINKEIELEFKGIKIFNSENPSLLTRNIFMDKSSVFIDEKIIKSSEILYINSYTKVNDYINLNKNSETISMILKYISDFPIINEENIEKIVSLINNNEANINILETNEGDLNKIISIFIDVIDLGYFDLKKFMFLLKNNFFKNYKLIVFDNVDWINVDILGELINWNNFIIITNDFTKYLDKVTNIDLLTFFDNNLEYFDILDNEKIISYLESKLNIELNNNFYKNNILNDKLARMKIIYEIYNLVN